MKSQLQRCLLLLALGLTVLINPVHARKKFRGASRRAAALSHANKDLAILEEEEPKLHTADFSMHTHTGSASHVRQFNGYSAEHAHEPIETDEASTGKGKGGSHHVKQSGKGKGKGSTHASKASGKGKGGSKHHSSGSGKGKGASNHHSDENGRGKGRSRGSTHDVSDGEDDDGHRSKGGSKGKGGSNGKGGGRSKGHPSKGASDSKGGASHPGEGSVEESDCIERDEHHTGSRSKAQHPSKRRRGLRNLSKHQVECEDVETSAPSMSPTSGPTEGFVIDEDTLDDGTDEANEVADEFTTAPILTQSPTATPVEVLEEAEDPVRARSVTVDVDDYRLEYDVISERLPLREELNALTNVTSQYLEGYVSGVFSDQEPVMTTIDGFGTEYQTGSFNMVDDLVHIQYSSVASVNSGSAIIPTTKEFNSLVEVAFGDANLPAYIAILRSLPSENLFQSVQGVRLLGSDTVQPVPNQGNQPERRSNSANGGAIAAGAVAITLLAAGIVIYKRRDNDYDETEAMLENEKKLGENGGDGNGTIAGDTYAETYDGTASVDASSLDFGARSHRDIEGGGGGAFQGANTLDPIAEGNDDSSITPAWDDESVVTSNQHSNLYAQPPTMQDISDDHFQDEYDAFDGPPNTSYEHSTETQPAGDAYDNASDGDYDAREEQHGIMSSDDVASPIVEASSTLCSEIQSVAEDTFDDDFHDEFEDKATEATGHEPELIGSIGTDGTTSAQQMASQKTEDIETFLSYCLDDPTGGTDVDNASLASLPREHPRPVSEEKTNEFDEASFSGSINADASTRPRTVSEIEAMLTSDDSVVGVNLIDEEEDETAPAVSAGTRTVAEIESMLSVDLDD